MAVHLSNAIVLNLRDRCDETVKIMVCKIRRVTLLNSFSGHESDAAFKRREKDGKS